MKIKAIKKVPFEGTVYNLGVEDDESYIANGIVVHNCRCLFSVVTKYDVQRLVGKGTGIVLSDDKPLPPNFPDKGFKLYTDEVRKITVTVEVPINSEKKEKKVGKEGLKCPYPNCGSLDITVTEDEQHTKTIYCNECLNDSKITREGDVYLHDKVKNDWIKEDSRLLPKNITGER